MKKRNDRAVGFHSTDLESAIKSDSPGKKSCDQYGNTKKLESTVSWIGKDSESQSIKYLEECNTHHNGE